MTELEEARAQRNASNRRIEELSKEVDALQVKFDAAQRVIERQNKDYSKLAAELWEFTTAL